MNDIWEWPRKYASSEIMKGKKVSTVYLCDLWSFGCILADVANFILRMDHDFRAFYGRNGTAYYSNLERVHQRIGTLEGWKQPAQTSTLDASLIRENVESHGFMPDIDHGMMDCLATIRRMLNENPSNRPIAKGLWKGFQSLSPRICDDCDERNETRWRPRIRQHQDTESGVSARRSQHRIHSPDFARNQNSRLLPESVPREYYLRQQRASSVAVNQQIPSMTVDHHLRQKRASSSAVNQPIPSIWTYESVLPPRFSISNFQAPRITASTWSHDIRLSPGRDGTV